AAQAVRKLKETYADSPYALIAEADLAYHLWQNGEGAPEVVRTLISESQKKSPFIADAYVTLAKLDLDQRRVASAATNAKLAYRIAPDKPEVRFVMARVAETQRKFEEAEQHYRRYIEVSGKPIRQSNTYHYLARMFEKMQPPQTDQAEEAYRNSVKLDPASPWKHKHYAFFLLYTRGDYEGALFYSGKAMELLQHSQFRKLAASAMYAKWADAYANKAVNYKPGYEGAIPLKHATADEWKKIEKVTGISAEAAFIDMAYSPALNYAVRGLLNAKAIENIDVKAEDHCGCTALVRAAEGNNFELAKFLVERRANMNASNNHGETALTKFVLRKNWPAVKYVIDHGARINFTDKDGDSPLDLVSMDDVAGMTLLLQHRADPNVIGKDGNTPLGRAVFAHRPDIAALLLKHGADPDQRLQLLGRPTVLALAVTEEAKDVVATLLRAGADPWLIDSDTYVAFDQADPETRRMLVEARALKPRPPASARTRTFSPPQPN
ncbi:MAG: ankyrin repeat and protein kinase protein 1-like, partial [Betaproteobacteria bacterium]|nr:ankyrin repeat and protein kinase protein 1-like [Betaproteobacteria bacterium]